MHRMSMTEISVVLANEAETLSAGAALAAALTAQMSHTHWTVNLEGNLGAGKTTISRGILRGLGYHAPVKSPTYTLVEAYEVDAGNVFHFDFYRLRDPQELEYLGVHDYFDRAFLCLVEWPEKADGSLPAADLLMALAIEGEGRRLTLRAASSFGESALKAFSLPTK